MALGRRPGGPVTVSASHGGDSANAAATAAIAVDLAGRPAAGVPVGSEVMLVLLAALGVGAAAVARRRR